MTRAEDARKKFWDPAMALLDVAAAEKAASVWRAAAEAEKLEYDGERVRLEAAGIRRAARSESRRFWVSVLAPLISALAVVAALWVQMYQINRNSGLQRESNDATSFRDAIKMIVSPDRDARVGGAMLLTVLLHSDTYGSTARQTSVGILSQPLDTDSFQIILRPFAAATNWDNVGDLVHITENLDRADTQVTNQLDALKNAHASRQVGSESPSSSSTIEQLEKDHNLLEEELRYSGQVLARMVKQKRPASQPLDLSRAYLFAVDLEEADLHNTVLTGARFVSCKVDKADFSNAKWPADSGWSGTAWWRAKSVSPELFDYLKTEYAYSGKPGDYPEDETSQQDYDQETARLKRDSAQH
jgi:hypothetical protein